MEVDSKWAPVKTTPVVVEPNDDPTPSKAPHSALNLPFTMSSRQVFSNPPIVLAIQFMIVAVTFFLVRPPFVMKYDESGTSFNYCLALLFAVASIGISMWVSTLNLF